MPTVTSNTFSVEVVNQWPAQDTVSYIPAVRNRNGSGVTAEGRGFGMDTRHAYSQWNVAAQTGTTPQIYHVTKNGGLDDGSLRYGLEGLTNPRIIVFDIGGVFDAPEKILTTGEVWVAGQTAPDQVWINTNADDIKCRGGDSFFQHIAFWNDIDIADVTRDALEVSETTGPFSDVVFDHCFFGGGTDGCIDMAEEVSNITLVDCLIALPRGATTHSKARGMLAGNEVNDGFDYLSLIGNVFAFTQARNPLTRCPHMVIANQLIYGRTNQSVAISSDTSSPRTHYQNIVGVYDKRGTEHNASNPPVQVDGTPLFPTASKVFVNDTRAVEYSSDEWDVVQDLANQEGDIRQNTVVTEAWPTGLVAADNRDRYTDAEYVTLLTQNVGPRPSERITFLQNVIDDIVAGTGAISDDYTAPTISSSTSVYSEPGSPHTQGSEAGRTVIEEDLLDKAEALLQ